MKYTTNISLGIKIVRNLYEVLGTKYKEARDKKQEIRLITFR